MSIDDLSRNKVGEALQLFISILNSGVSIVTREPRRTSTQDSINDIASLLEPLISMRRAHEESATKSFRLKDTWAKKKRAAQGIPLTRIAPRWRERTEEGYKLVPERAEAVRKIFRLSAEGLGVQRILNFLIANPEKYPPFGDSGKWRDSYVQQILNNQAVFGKFQPRMREAGDQRVDCGQPITSDFPRSSARSCSSRFQSGMQGRFRVLGQPDGLRGLPPLEPSGLRLSRPIRG